MDEQTPQKRKFDMSVAKQMHTKGKTYREIAEHFDTTEQRVRNEFYLERKEKEEAQANKRPRGRPKGSKNKRTIAEEKFLANWETSAISPAMREDKAELNRAAAWFVTECLKTGRSADRENIESLTNALSKYIELCVQSGMPMTMKTCQLALGLTPGMLASWRSGASRSANTQYKEFAEMVYAIVGAGLEASSSAGALDRVLLIWWEKAHFNMVEGDGRDLSQNDPLGERKSASEIAEKYNDLPD